MAMPGVCLAKQGVMRDLGILRVMLHTTETLLGHLSTPRHAHCMIPRDSHDGGNGPTDQLHSTAILGMIPAMLRVRLRHFSATLGVTGLSRGTWLRICTGHMRSRGSSRIYAGMVRGSSGPQDITQALEPSIAQRGLRGSLAEAIQGTGSIADYFGVVLVGFQCHQDHLHATEEL